MRCDCSVLFGAVLCCVVLCSLNSAAAAAASAGALQWAERQNCSLSIIGELYEQS